MDPENKSGQGLELEMELLSNQQMDETIHQIVPGVWAIRGFLDGATCKALISLESAAKEYTYCRKRTAVRFRQDTIRSLYSKIRKVCRNGGLSLRIGADHSFWSPMELNDYWRFVAGGEGSEFPWHTDGKKVSTINDVSFYTVMFYLNDNFDGGALQVQDDRGHIVTYQPTVGDLVILRQSVIVHRGQRVCNGTKYLIRSEIMYRREDQCDDPERLVEQYASANTDEEAQGLIDQCFRLQNLLIC
jgi:hypothetical protein